VIPRLETPRLVMRGWRNEDLDAHAAMSADPEVQRYLEGVLDRAVACGFDHLGVGRLISVINPDNTASLRVAAAKRGQATPTVLGLQTRRRLRSGRPLSNSFAQRRFGRR
jgi:hypothetical protein